MKKIIALVLALVLSLSLTCAFAAEKISVIATENPHAEVMELIKDDLAALSKEIKDQIDSMTADELKEAINQFKKDLKNNEVMAAATDITDEGKGPCAVYNAYYTENYPG